MRRSLVRGRIALIAGMILAIAITAAVTNAAPKHRAKPDRVVTKSDAAKAKLAPELVQTLDSGSTARVPVFVSLKDGNLAATRNLLTGEHVAKRGDVALVVGRVGAQQLAKLAGVAGVLNVEPVNFKQTGKPDVSDPDGIANPDRGKKTANENLRDFQKTSVPYDKAPPLKTSHFDQLASANVLDAKTHNFTGAWSQGFTGSGITASVLDGGTDWGHPDLIGTWQIWTADELDQMAADGLPVDTNWAGWPKAFDPYDTLVYLVAPDFIDQGLTWYTKTTAAQVQCGARRSSCGVEFATMTGPSRNLPVDPGTATHTYKVDPRWSKSGTVKLGSHPDDHLLDLYGERPAFVVTDPHTAGVYDTVYVDLDDNYDFTDDKPVTKSSPVSYRDLNGDGYTDLSGGLLYYISDGNTLIPGGPTDFGVGDTPGPGDFLAWTGDFDPAIEGHGTLTASNVVGQAVINGKSPHFKDVDIKKAKDHEIPGMVLGGAPDTKLAPMGDIYFSFPFSTQFGYLLTNEYGVQVTSNSYGNSDDDNDGMDAASQEADLIHAAIGGNTVTPVFSTGNGAPGFGTATSPAPVRAISVGASTQFGGTGWDSIKNISQVTDNDVIEWSNRGPGANGRDGVDVVADGSYSTGDATLNTVIDGRNAWTTWGGTSRSTPVAVGAVSLIYQAWAASHGGAFPNALQARSVLKSSAKDLNYGSFVQGAGSVDAGKAVDVARGTRARITPDEWRPSTASNGLAAPQPISAGESKTQAFTLAGPGTWNLSDRQLQRYDTESFAFTSAPLAQESVSNFNAPDYLMDITNKIKAHSDADIVVIRANYPRSEFDGDGNYQSDQAWRLLAYNWTDNNHNGRLWQDKNGNGVVNHADKNKSSNIDGFNDIDFGKSEMDEGEYERFFYHRPGANTLMGFVRNPAQRMADGVFLGFQHSTKNPAINQTHFQIRIDYYKNVDWSWLTTPATATGSFNATFSVPAGTPAGMYEGAIVASKGSDRIVVPVSATVAVTAAQNADGTLAAPFTFGGSSVANAQSNLLYNNGSFFGANDWTWREESGDWRFFYFNVANATPPGTLFLTDTTWDDPGALTDLDTLVFGPTANEFQLFNPTVVFGTPPGYMLDTVGGSANAYIGSGTWRFNTATGGNEDIVAAPASGGLHAVVEHGVSFNGDKFDVPFQTSVGSASVAPTSITQTTATGSGSFDVTFKANVALPGVSAEAFGLSQPSAASIPVKQDDPNTPSTAGFKRVDAIAHASRATWTLPNVGGDDLDLYVVYDANHDGNYTSSEIVGSSTGGAGVNESVTLVAPPDGNYQVWVHGFAVSGPHNVPLNTDIVQGTDLTVSGVPAGGVAAGTPVTLHVTYAKSPMPAGTYKGELLLGPSTAPSAVSVPITITRS
jgi:hypothetical protein